MRFNDPPVLFTTSEYGYLGALLLQSEQLPGPVEEGQIERKRFPDGERYQRIATEVHEREVILVGGTIDDDATLELYDLASALVTYGARRLTLVIPYFGYSTMERATRRGEVVTAKARTRLLSSIPPASYGNRALLMDLHSEGIPHYFEGALTATHLYAKSAVGREARRLGGDSFVLACTDAGRAKWVESLANDLGVSASFVFKRRLDGERTEVTATSAKVAGREVVIYDDMVRTGGSLIEAARAYRDAGALRLSAICTHALLPGDALSRIRDSGLFEELVCTDTHPRARSLADDFLTVISVADLFAPHLTSGAPVS